MQPFLEKTVSYIHDKYGDDISRLCIVLPNKRAGLFLRKHISEIYKKPIWAPQIYSNIDFIEKISGVYIADYMELLFRFYHIYRDIEGKDAQQFDEFIDWAQILLQDFNEADQNLVDTKQLFSYLNESYALSTWNPGKPELTDAQKEYLRFWQSLGGYYDKFTNYLKENNLAYQGLCYRLAAEIIVNEKSHDFSGQWEKILFVGFNALNKAEETIIKTLVSKGKAEVLWDTDVHYMKNESQEAGTFLRKYRDEWNLDEFRWESDTLDKDEMEIEVIGVPGDVLQAKAAGEILSGIDFSNAHQHTAVVLANEDLLIPMLQSLPENTGKVNVTMGYPLKNSPMHSLLNGLLQLHENASKASHHKFYYRDINAVLAHPYIRSAKTSETAQHIMNEIRKRNLIFLSGKDIEKLAEGTEGYHALQMLFTPWKNDIPKALESITELIGLLKNGFTSSETEAGKPIEMEHLYTYAKLIKRLSSLLDEYGTITSIKTLRALFNRLAEQMSIDFYGEPLTGLQVMGMLETRMLDFENVILLSVNEGILPKAKTLNSFIPFDIRKKFKLPTYTEKDAIFAYHFYRLLQRAKKVFLLYNTEADSFGSGEKSRFITQILHEFKHVKITEKLLSIPVSIKPPNPTRIEKDAAIIAAIKEKMQKGISPSALNTYINCPLDFYYKYIARVQEPEEVEETIEASTLGKCVHAILENFYKPFEGELINAAHIKAMLPSIEENTFKVFKGEFREQDILFGKNLLVMKVAERFVKNFLQQEIGFLEELNKTGEELTIVSIEEKLACEIEVSGIKVNLRGKADRIDRIGNQLRIIDYKTGWVKPGSLKVGEMDEVVAESKYDKVLQLLAYALMYKKMHPGMTKTISPGIVSFRKLSEGFMPLRLKDVDEIEPLLGDFEKQLAALAADIMNPATPFEHLPDADYCRFCEI